MSIRVDRVLGYACDINGIDYDTLSKAVDGEFRHLGIYSSYDNEDIENKIAVFHDGLDGEYTYLIFVQFFDNDCGDFYESEKGDIYDEVNKFLKDTKIPNNIKDSMMEKLDVLGVDKSKVDNTKLMMLRHFH